MYRVLFAIFVLFLASCSTSQPNQKIESVLVIKQSKNEEQIAPEQKEEKEKSEERIKIEDYTRKMKDDIQDASDIVEDLLFDSTEEGEKVKTKQEDPAKTKKQD